MFSNSWFGTPRTYRHFGLKPIDGVTSFDTFNDYRKKLAIVLSNPAMLKVITLQCDMFSLGKIYVYQDGKAVDNDPFLKLIKSPNYMQQQSQFLWDYMFWNMIGNAYCYVDSKLVERASGNQMYWLDPGKIEWPQVLEKARDKFVLSDKTRRELMDTEAIYRYSDGTSFDFQMKKIIAIGDISNGLGNWFASPSKIDALYKVISNSEASLDSSNINIRYTGKFMVSGKNTDINSMPMTEDDKKDVEDKVDSQEKNVHAIKSAIDIKRFIEDGGTLKQLDEAYLNTYFIIGSMYGIPKDVLEAYNSGTYENQEKARGAHVSYCLQPKGNILMNAFERMFGYEDKDIVIDWEHLPFMQVFAKDRADAEFKKTQSLLNLLRCGVNVEEINAFLDTEFTELELKQIQNEMGQNTGQGAQGEQGQINN